MKYNFVSLELIGTLYLVVCGITDSTPTMGFFNINNVSFNKAERYLFGGVHSHYIFKGAIV